MQQHILLVEDDPAIAMSLKITFKREGWQVSWLDNASDVASTLENLHAMDTASNPQFTPLTAIILDVGLPDGDGLSLCQHIRHNKTIGNIQNLPILFLTARSDEVDRILGLEMGADDYCAKPFSPRELVARLKAIWRRQDLIQQSNINAEDKLNLNEFNNNTRDHNPTISFNLDSGLWRYEKEVYRLFWHDVKLELSNTERKLLLHFLHHPQQVFSREQLLSAISDNPDHRLARTIDSHIKSIRKQLATINSEIEVIYTHRGIGYGMCAS